MNKHHTIQYLILSTILIGGCIHLPGRKPVSPDIEIPNDLDSDIGASGTQVTDAANSTGEIAAEQRKVNIGISTDTKSVQAGDGGKFKKQTGSILSFVGKSNALMKDLDKTTKDLLTVKESLTVSQTTSKQLQIDATALREIASEQEASIQNLTEERDKLKSDLETNTKAFLNKLFAVLIVLGIVAIGISAYSAWGAIQMGASPFKAIGMAVGGATITCVSIAFMYYSQTIGKVIVAVVIVCAVSLVWKLLIDLKRRNTDADTIDLQKKAIDYNTRLTEGIKTEVMSDAQKEIWFGKKHTNGLAGGLQGDDRVFGVIDESRSRMENLDSPTVTT